MSRRRAVVIVAAVVWTAAATFVIACGDEGGSARAPFEPSDGSTVEASLPEAAPPPVDAGAEARAPFDAAAPVIACAKSPCPVRLVAGAHHYCALLDDRSLRCWGQALALGSADAGATGDGTVPVKVAVPPALDVSAGGEAACIVAQGDAGVVCWDTQQPEPQPSTEGAGGSRVWLADDGYHRCVLRGSVLHCFTQAGANIYSPNDVTLGAPPTAVALTFSRGAALASDGHVDTWGDDFVFLGRSISSVGAGAAAVEGLPPVLSIATAGSAACAIANDGRLLTWGRGGAGLLGLGYNRDETRPLDVRFSSTAWPQQASMSTTHACVRTTDGAVWCWGASNARGQLGLAQAAGVYVPTKVEGLDDVIVAQVVAGQASTCALAVDGSIRCWGDNTYGQLGRGERDDARHPVPALVEMP